MRTIAALVAGAVASVLLVGCAGTGEYSSDASVGTAAVSGPMVAEGVPVPSDEIARDMAVRGPSMEPSGPEVFPMPVYPGEQRQVVKTADAQLRVDRVDDAVRNFASMVARLDGVITAEQLSGTGQAQAGSVTARVPAGSLDTLVGRLGTLGTVESLTATASDVAAQVVDLDARVAALQASVARLQKLIASATTVADLVTAESELTRRQAELDGLRAQQRVLSDQVAMSTLSVYFTAAVPALPVGRPGFTDSVQAGWVALQAAVSAGVSSLGFALPFLVLLLPAAALLASVLVVVRRRRRK